MRSGGYAAKHRDPVAEAVGLNVGVELRAGGRVTRPLTGDRQLPRQIARRAGSSREFVSAPFRLYIRYRADTVFPSRGEGISRTHERCCKRERELASCS